MSPLGSENGRSTRSCAQPSMMKTGAPLPRIRRRATLLRCHLPKILSLPQRAPLRELTNSGCGAVDNAGAVAHSPAAVTTHTKANRRCIPEQRAASSTIRHALTSADVQSPTDSAGRQKKARHFCRALHSIWFALRTCSLEQPDRYRSWSSHCHCQPGR
jgi:hypothetical protein